MTVSIKTQVDIAARPEQVWLALMDFSSFPSWNPFIKSIKGVPRIGERLTVVIQPPGLSPQTFRPRVIAADTNKRFAWRGALPIPGLFSGEHCFSLSLAQGGTRFIQSETFSGLLLPFLKSALAKTERGFQLMNKALKAQVEAGGS